MRNAARAAVIAVGAIYAWQWRFYVNPDAVAYFDVVAADQVAEGVPRR